MDEIPKYFVDWQFGRSMACFQFLHYTVLLPFEALSICTICRPLRLPVLNFLYSLFPDLPIFPGVLPCTLIRSV